MREGISEVEGGGGGGRGLVGEDKERIFGAATEKGEERKESQVQGREGNSVFRRDEELHSSPCMREIQSHLYVATGSLVLCVRHKQTQKMITNTPRHFSPSFWRASATRDRTRTKLEGRFFSRASGVNVRSFYLLSRGRSLGFHVPSSRSPVLRLGARRLPPRPRTVRLCEYGWSLLRYTEMYRSLRWSCDDIRTQWNGIAYTIREHKSHYQYTENYGSARM